MEFWLSFSQPGSQHTAGRAEPMFSDEGILRIKCGRKASPVITLTAMEDRWASVCKGQKHWRDGSHGDLGELGLGSLFFHLAVILLIKDVKELFDMFFYAFDFSEYWIRM